MGFYKTQVSQISRRIVAFAFGLCVSLSAVADTTALTLGSATRGSSNTPVTLNFPVTRNGDVSYDTVLNYHTVDGSASSGIDYIGGPGSIVIPAGAASATIPITITANTSNNPTVSFQLLLDSATGAGPAPGFASQLTFAVGANPQTVAVADFNGDGKLDLVVANHDDNTISVLLDTTSPQYIISTRPGPFSVAIADINGDGKPDLIVANYNDNSVSVFLNTTASGAATPSFSAPSTFPVGSGPISITTVDVNGDGKPDVIAANFNGGSISVLLNTTTPGASAPSFAIQRTFGTGVYSDCVVSADINGDGKPDLIVANKDDSTISVLLNTTTPGAITPSFASQQTFATQLYPQSVTVVDLNGDGKPDLVVANNGASTLSVLINTTLAGASVPSFATQQTFPTGSNPTSVAAADIDGDGKPDLVVANSGENTVSVLRNTMAPGATQASFTARRSFIVGSGPDSVALADVNGDGKLDLVVANSASNNISVLLNTTTSAITTPNFAARKTFAVGSGPQSVAVADINGDGKPDLVVANAGYSPNFVSVLLNTTAPGATTPSFAVQETFASATQHPSVTTADINGDGRPDLIVANPDAGTVSVLLNITAPGDATANFGTEQTFATGMGPISVAAADLNGDGRPDLIVANASDNTVSVLLNTTTPGDITPSFASQQTFATGSVPFCVTAADVNGDGRPDLIVANDGDSTVSILLNSTAPGATIPSFAAQQKFDTGANPRSVTAADINGDGKLDLITANYYGNTISVLLNTTAPGAVAASFGAQQSFTVGSAPTSVATADVDGDGRPDLIVANSVSGTVSMLLNTTASGSSAPSFATQQTFATGTDPVSVIAADLNGDSRPDLIVANYAGPGVASVLLNTQYQSLLFGSPATGTIVHDYIFADGFQ